MEDAMNQETQPPPALEQMETAWEIQERPFTSPTPLIGPLLAWLRTAWNSVSTKWYVRALIQQQNQFNRLTVQQFYQIKDQYQATSNHLAALNTRLDTQLTAFDSRLSAFDSRLSAFDSRLSAFDSRLLAQDHDQSDLLYDVGELTAQFVQLHRQLQALEDRLVKLEQEKGTARNLGEVGETPEDRGDQGDVSGRDNQSE
jgi:hypothetical protein